MEIINNKDLRLAVLIDADNISSKYIGSILQEIAKYGEPTFKRLYGDVTNSYIAGWKEPMMEYAITPVQQFGYTTGKNSSDSALIIDAMDILYTSNVDGFCIISSDSDFTRLATRLREAGKLVLGFGEQKTPKPFIAACNRFTYIEILDDEDQEDLFAVNNKTKTESKPTSKQRTTPPKKKVDPSLVRLIKKSITDTADDDGWVFLGVLGNMLMKKRPDFDARNYGYKKLLDIIVDISDIEIASRINNKDNISHYYVRLIY